MNPVPNANLFFKLSYKTKPLISIIKVNISLNKYWKGQGDKKKKKEN